MQQLKTSKTGDDKNTAPSGLNGSTPLSGYPCTYKRQRPENQSNKLLEYIKASDEQIKVLSGVEMQFGNYVGAELKEIPEPLRTTAKAEITQILFKAKIASLPK